MNSGYAEMRQHVCQGLFVVSGNQWQPWRPSTQAFLDACQCESDPLKIRNAPFMNYLSDILAKLPQWKEQRLPPPRVSQSEYDKVGLTLLQWIWISAHGPTACLVLPYAKLLLPEIFRMSELNDSSDLQTYSSAVLYILSAVTPPADFIESILDSFVVAVKSSTSWKIRLHSLPALVVFFYRNLLSISQDGVAKVVDVLLDCLSDENVEVREMASKVFSGVVRCSQRQSIIPLKNRFVALAKKTPLPPRRDPSYAESLKILHSAILGICALIESLPYSVEPWMPSLTEVLAPHATDPPPISTTIRNCASEFKKTHQDTWHKDQLLFDEDQLQSLSAMLVGTSYYA
jgi:proteasome activator subunit 4